VDHYSQRQIDDRGLHPLYLLFPDDNTSIQDFIWIIKDYTDGKIEEIRLIDLEWAIEAIEDEFMHLGSPFPFLRDLICQIRDLKCLGESLSHDSYPFGEERIENLALWLENY
jgi:hypothetical protein